VATKALLVVQLDPTDPVDRLGDWLRSAGLELDVRDLSAGDDLPGDLADHSGLVVLGGSMSANDDASVRYLSDVKALLRRAVISAAPTLAVCLGAQLLAVANGGRVERNPDGPEIGAQLIAKRSAASDDPLFAALPITPDVIQWHYDAITVLPAGAVQLASSIGCEQQAFRLGPLAWGVQFHIETSPATIHLWAQDPELAEYDLTALVERTIRAHDDVAEVWQPFAAAFAGVVADPESTLAAAAELATQAAAVAAAAGLRASLAGELGASRLPPPMSLGMPSLRPSHDA
jgi:GMP synthase (glutamine-hydrolysing)